MKHTPAPWKIKHGHNTLVVRDFGNNPNISQIIADVNKCGMDGTEANARLIAAAPELLSILKDIDSWLEI